MPLVRVEVRNEYGLGALDMHENANNEDPKAVLDGVAVAGLVGILRQLGDLAEFAAEVFHELQEEVMITSSRSCKLMGRVQQIDKALPPLEKAVLGQRSHLHLAYTAGCNWHACIRCGKNHFVYGDTPQFIMDSYEDCRSPPRLQLLDKFDPGGPGSCLRRYSDPTFFKRASAGYGEACSKKIRKDKKVRRTERRSSWLMNGKVSQDASIPNHTGRMQFTKLNVDEQVSASQTVTTYDETFGSDFVEQSNIDSRNKLGFVECVVSPSYLKKPDEQECKELSSPSNGQRSASPDCSFLEKKGSDVHHDSPNNLSLEQIGCPSSSVTWDEKEEMLEPVVEHDLYGNLGSFPPNFELEMHMFTESSSSSKRQLRDSPGFNFFKEKDSGAYDDTQNNLSIEQTGHSSSSVAWDEKEEILEPTTDYDHDGNLGLFSPNFEPEIQGYKPDNFENVDQMDVHPCNETVTVLDSGENQLDDIESETDHFMDALHTIESESETDKDCATKHEVQHYSKLEDKAVVDISCGFRTHHSEFRSSNFESDILANSSLVNGIDGRDPISGSDGCDPISMSPNNASSSYCFTDREAAKDKFNPVSFEHNTHLQSTQKGSELLNPGGLQGVDSHEKDNVDVGVKVEYVLGKVSSSDLVEDMSRMPITSRTTSSPKSQVPAPETSSIASVMFWTNGGLLGLEPSKPPDCSVLNAIPKGPMNGEDGKVSTFSQSSLLSSGKDAAKPDQIGNSEKMEQGMDVDCSTSCQGYREDGLSLRKEAWKYSPMDLSVKLEKSSDSTHPNYVNIPAVKLDVQRAKDHQESNRSSSRIFELGDRLTNGSNKRLSLEVYKNHGPINNVNAKVFKQNNNISVAHQTSSKDLFGAGSPFMSPSSSPPLEHMKIFFHPIQDFETSKLKLKFPDGNGNPENSRDIFPSFQLVPEASIAWHNVASDSDDQTFYRSSPSVSDGCHSNQSESDSEQWESNDCPSNKDHDVYDALRRISLTDCVSTIMENERTNHGEIYDSSGLQSRHSFNLPSLDTLNHSFTDDWPNAMSEGPKAPNYAVNLVLSASTISQLPKPDPLEQNQITASTELQKNKVWQSDLQKKNRRKETNQAECIKSMDEQEDFLHQIRTKSSNLRPTVSTKSTMSSGPPANVNVTAILEKANAIRCWK
ncbi:protein SCAR3-like isoform X4 [Olea europaea var. sylvestris]|uniref:protein SCAR3-like isoform X4 n=1 Tax=Olea europaea var. sylvestris TaxID=158386 RepID=UPI000C1D2553|nr:protein SCAR3-like isoform X4 [Olea europaea var. sylvestris]